MSCELSTHAVSLVLLGALVFVNLFVALVVSDISQLQHSAELQKLVNTAQHIVVFESLFKAFRCCRPMFKTRKPIKDIVRICPHRMCRCGRDGNENRAMTPDIVDGLREIIRRRNEAKEVVTLGALLRNKEKSKVVKDVLRVLTYSNT